MCNRSLLRLAALFSLVSSIGAYAAAQDVRQGNGSPSSADTAVIQYYSLFRRLVKPPPPRNRPTPESADQINQPQPDVRAMLHRRLELSDAEARVLDQIAADCISKTDKLDQQAQEISAAHRAEVRAGKAPPTSPPPSVLLDLQKQRDDTIRNAIEQLRAQFGEAEFKRLNDSFSQNSAAGSVQLPPPYQKPLPVDVKIALLDQSAGSSQGRFAAKERFTVEVAMLNQSTQMISIKMSELYMWLQFNTPGQPEVIGRVSPRFLFEKATSEERADQTTMIDLPPNQLRVVTQINFGPGAVSLPPGQYQLTVHPKVIYARPPKSDFLQLSLASPFNFEIVP